MEKGVPIRSVSRSIAALKAINQHGSLSMMEIARTVAVPYPTACRIIQTLVHEGLIEQEPSRKHYRPTALVQSLAQGFARDGRLIECARPSLLHVTEKLGWPVSITTRVGVDMVLRDSTHANTSLTFERYYPGFTLPVLECASGRLTLAFTDRDELRSLLPGLQLKNEQLRTIEDAERLLNLDEIRRQGFAWLGRGWKNLTPGRTSSLAVPIMEQGHMTAALTLVYFHNAVRYQDVLSNYLPILRDAAEVISRNLSGQPEPVDRAA